MSEMGDLPEEGFCSSSLALHQAQMELYLSIRAIPKKIHNQIPDDFRSVACFRVAIIINLSGLVCFCFFVRWILEVSLQQVHKHPAFCGLFGVLVTPLTDSQLHPPEVTAASRPGTSASGGREGRGKGPVLFSEGPRVLFFVSCFFRFLFFVFLLVLVLFW